MGRYTYVPGPPLSDHVELLWGYDAYGAGHARERVLPTATSEIVVVLRDERSGPVICGAHSESFVIDTADRPTLLGVHFKPGGAAPFLKMPADELANARVALDAVWGGWRTRERSTAIGRQGGGQIFPIRWASAPAE